MGKGFNQRSEKGSFLGMALLLGVIFMILLASIMVLVQVNKSNSNKLIWQERLQRLMNEGYISAMSDVRLDPTLRTFNRDEKISAYGVYSADAQFVRDTPGDLKSIPELESGIYLTVSATTTDKRATHPSMKLIAIVQSSDAGQYFGSAQDYWVVDASATIPNGSFYGKALEVQHDFFNSGAKPKVGSLYFSTEARLYDVSNTSDLGMILTAGDEYDFFETADAPTPGKGIVHKISPAPIFPTVNTGTMARLKKIASGGSINSVIPHDHVFNGHIYPPGCGDQHCASLSNDDLINHVYYVQGDIQIQGIVYGQVLFVAEGKITITGDLISDSLTGPDPDYSVYPGCSTPCRENRASNPKPDASNANQVVLITPNGYADAVSIDTGPELDLGIGIWPTPPHYLESNGGPLPDDTEVLTIEAFVVAPAGGVRVKNIRSVKPYVNFVGALILGQGALLADGLEYPPGMGSEYMESLRTRPPPYVPNFVQLKLWHEGY